MMSCRLRNCRNRKKEMSGKLVLREESFAKKMLSIRENALAFGAPPQTP